MMTRSSKYIPPLFQGFDNSVQFQPSIFKVIVPPYILHPQEHKDEYFLDFLYHQ